MADDDLYVGGTLAARADHGVATFADLTLRHAGPMYLTFGDGDLRSASLAGLTVTPGPAAVLAFAAAPQSVEAGHGQPVAVDVLDAYHNKVAAGPTVTLATPVDVRAAAPVSGTATFGSVVLTHAGTYTLTATAAGLSDAVSDPFDVTPVAEAAHVAFVVPPVDAVAGQPCADVAVELQDGYGNVIHDRDGTTVAYALTGPAGTVTQPVVVVDGQAVLLHGTVLTAAGAYSVAIADPALVATSTRTFTVVAGAAERLAVTPATVVVTAGEPIDPLTVTATDAYGNPVALDGPTAAVAGAAVGGPATAAFVGGVARFAGLTLSSAGDYTLAVTVGNLTPATVPVRVRPALLPSASAVAGRPVGPVTVDVASVFPGSADRRSLSVVVTCTTSAAVRPVRLTARVANGRATFKVPAMRVAGRYTVRVTGADGDAAEQSFAVVAAAATRVRFASQPVADRGTVTAAVCLCDRYGNAVTAAAGTAVGLTVTAPRGQRPTLAGPATAAVDAAGVARFAGLSTTAVTNARLVATVAGLPPARSDPFTVA